MPTIADQERMAVRRQEVLGWGLMQVDTIQAARAEIMRLLDEQKSRLHGMLATDLLKDRAQGDGHHRSLDRQSAERIVEVLDNEIHKVDRLEMVLAVVGTMKAGKSTVINAIVGTEVLPNRNQPMTTLPTLIRHKAGQKSPRLHFPKIEPIVAMVEDIRTVLEEMKAAGRLEDVLLYNEADGRDLIERVIDGRAASMATTHTGPEAIFAFLKSLNDLTRLARDPWIGIDPPFEEYGDVDELPVIEVEYVHLRDLAETRQGSFALLDTPGHNESGQRDKLIEIVRDQLAKASAVLAVLDYTQLKSEAEEEVRRELEDIAEQVEDRLFVLVNKFDQKDRHGMKADEIRHHVGDALMEGRVPPARVFPISARYAYLANGALNVLAAGRPLPDPKSHPWVEDFGSLALGSFWEEEIANPQKVRSAAARLWSRSLFASPLKHVVVSAAQQAAVISMKSALAKLAECGRTVDNFMQLRRRAMVQETEDVESLIAGLEQDIAGIDDMQVEARRVVKEVTDAFEGFVDDLYRRSQDLLNTALEECFTEARRFEKPDAGTGEEKDEGERTQNLVPEASGRDGTLGFGQRFAGRPGAKPAATFGKRAAPARTESAAAGPSESIRLDSLDDAERVSRTIAGRMKAIFEQTVRDTTREFTRSCVEMETGFAASIRERVEGVLAKAQKRLRERGFPLELDFPAPRLDGVAIEISGSVGSLLARKTERRVAKRERDGLGAGVGRLLWGGESGYETYTYNEVFYEVDAARIRGKFVADLDAAVFEMRRQAHDFAKQALEPRILAYFDGLRGFLEGFRGDLLDAIDDHRLDGEALSALERHIDSFAAGMQENFDGIAALREGLDSSIPELEDEAEEADPAEPFVPADVPAAPPTEAVPEAVPEAASPAATDADEATVALNRPLKPRLVLTYQGKEYGFEGAGPIVIGRSPDCGIPVSTQYASRNHATVEFRDGGFVVTDHSTNGTVVVGEDGTRQVLSRASMGLPAAGALGIGGEPDEGPDGAVGFALA